MLGWQASALIVCFALYAKSHFKTLRKTLHRASLCRAIEPVSV